MRDAYDKRLLEKDCDLGVDTALTEGHRRIPAIWFDEYASWKIEMDGLPIGFLHHTFDVRQGLPVGEIGKAITPDYPIHFFLRFLENIRIADHSEQER